MNKIDHNYIVNFFDVIAQRQFLIESFLAIFTRVADNQMDTVAVIAEGVLGVESCRTLLTGVLSFVAVGLQVTLQKTCTAEWSKKIRLHNR